MVSYTWYCGHSVTLVYNQCLSLPKVYFYKYTVFTRSKECLTIRRSIVHATCEVLVRRGLYL